MLSYISFSSKNMSIFGGVQGADAFEMFLLGEAAVRIGGKDLFSSNGKRS